MASLISGKARKPHRRTVKLLSSGASVVIDVPSWVKFSPGSFVKEFDSNNTSILRVWKQKNGDGVMVYGMRGENGKAAVEAYEIVPIPSMASVAVDAVAKACGIEDLSSRVVL